MKKRIKKLHRSNKGFTLMELIVTMLISSIVTAAVAGFFSMGLNYYRRTNVETALQTESQVAELFLTELFQESQYYQYYEETSCPTGVTSAVELERDGDLYVVAQKGEYLVYGEVTDTGVEASARIQQITDESLDKVFLARYVDTFSVEPSKREDSVNSDYYNGLVKLTLEFDADGWSYTGTQTVLLRNKIKN